VNGFSTAAPTRASVRNTLQYVGSIAGGDGVVVMVNSDNGNILQEVINSVAAVYHWKDFFKPEDKP
jgi:3-hydroxy-3-methylglutaryl CoA synthase